ncbi:MAG: hypothetical protein Q3971_01070 [Moraxella sp.]|nr:hypothetical protein [Moraxella sp.]
MKTLSIFCILCLVACHDNLTHHKTADNLLEFYMDSSFKKVQTNPKLGLDIYQKKNYHLQIIHYPNHHPALQQRFDDYKNQKRIFKPAYYTTTADTIKIDNTVLNLHNHNGHDFVVFYTKVQDLSALIPTYYGIAFVLMKTPHGFVEISLKQQAHKESKLSQKQAFEYLSSIIQTIK